MDPRRWRKSKGLSLQKLANELGLTSRGRLNTLELGGDTWPTDLAIKMDRYTGGAVPVHELRPDLHDVRVIRPPHSEASA